MSDAPGLAAGSDEKAEIGPAEPPAPSAQPQRDGARLSIRMRPRLGRSAALLHALAWAFAGATIFTDLFLDPREEPFYTVLGVGASAVLILFTWSVILAAVAVLRAEAPRLPAGVLLLSLSYLTVGYLLLWRYHFSLFLVRGSPPGFWDFAGYGAFWLGLLLFVPMLYAAAIGALLGYWKVRRAVRRAEQAGGEPWSPGRRWRLGLLWFFGALLVLAVPLMPCLPFLYSAVDRWNHPTWDWRFAVSNGTPNYARGLTVRFLWLSDDGAFMRSRSTILWTGQLTKAQTLAHLFDAKPGKCEIGFRALSTSYVEEARAQAVRMGDGEWKPAEPIVLRYAGEFLAQRGEPEEIRRYLDPARKSPQMFRVAFLRELAQCKRWEYVPDLVKYLAHDPPEREEALFALARLADDTQREECWAEFATRSSMDFRCDAAAALKEFTNLNLRARLMIRFLSAADWRIQSAAMEEYSKESFLQNAIVGFGTTFEGSLIPWVEVLGPLLQSPQPGVRRMAAFHLSGVFDLPAPNIQLKQGADARKAVVFSGSEDPEFKPLEELEIQRAKETAEKYLLEMEKK
ncbi:MAG: hypothetical protein L6R28_21825 [Planctomycetes bacterium]|nr:hypothetical protein [Planctomycetota bacterium]